MKTKIYSYQKFVQMLNHGVSDGLISYDEAIDLLCEAMPQTFHRGSFSSPDLRGVVCVKHRLSVWEYGDEKDVLHLFDVFNYLEGN